MNEKGQFLLYDAILAIILIFIVITAIFYILNQEEDFMPDNNEVFQRLNMLSSYNTGNNNILIDIEENNSKSKEIVMDILSDKDYVLYDLSLNKTVLSKHSNEYTNSISARKVIENHEFELTFYS